MVDALRETQSKHDAGISKAKLIQQILEDDVQKIKTDLTAAEDDKEEAKNEAANLRKQLARLKSELEREKDNHLAHVQKVKANLLAEYAKDVDEMKANLQKKKTDVQRTVDVPKELRKETERLKVENKSLQKNADGNKTMKGEVPELKKLVAEQEKMLSDATREANILEAKLERVARNPTNSKLRMA